MTSTLSEEIALLRNPEGRQNLSLADIEALLARTGYPFDEDTKPADMPVPPADIVFLLHQKAWLLGIEGKFDVALEFLQEAARFGNKYSVGAALIQVYLLIIAGYQRIGKYSQSLEYSEQFLPFFEEHASLFQLGRFYFNKAYIYRLMGKSREALDAYSTAQVLFQEVSDLKHLADAIGGMGNVHGDLHNYERALEYYQQAYELEKEHGTEEGAIIWLGNTALVFINNKEFDKAEEIYRYIIAIVESSSDRLNLNYWYGNFSSVFMLTGRYDECYSYLQKAIAEAQHCGNTLGEGMWLAKIGELYTEKDFKFFNEEKAAQLIEKGLALLNQSGAKPETLHIREKLANIYKNQRKWKKYAISLEKLREEEKKLHSQEVQKFIEQHDFERKIAEQQQLRSIEQARRETTEQQNVELQAQNEEILRQRYIFEEQAAEIEERNVLLQESAERIKELMRFKQLLMATIVHDLKNPLNTIINTAAYHNHPDFYSIESASRSMLALVNNILELQKLEDTNLSTNLSPTTAKSLFGGAIEEVELFLNQKNITLDFNIQANDAFQCDTSLLHRVMVNLLSNAIKYSPVGSTIVIGTELKEDAITIFVEDNGRGIPADRLHSIFNQYEQGDQAQDYGFVKSTGLGLTFCRLAVEAHKGKIYVSSEQGKGSTFFVDLPYVPADFEFPEATTDDPLTQPPREILHPQEADLEVVSRLYQELKQHNIPLYDYTEILNYFDKFDFSSPFLLQWRSTAEIAIVSGDEVAFYRLFEDVLQKA